VTWRKALLGALAASLGLVLLHLLLVGAAFIAGFVYHRLTYEPTKVTMHYVERPAAGGSAAAAAPLRGVAGEANSLERGAGGTNSVLQLH
jgi:hypothetical protein